MLSTVMSLFVICVKSTYQLLNCVIREAVGCGSRNVVMSGKHYHAAFVVSTRFCTGIILLLSLPVHGASVITDYAEQTDSLHNCSNVCVFTEHLLFPKSSAIVLRDFAGNGPAIDSIRRFLSVTDTRNFLNIKITGSYSPEGKYAFNQKLAYARANALSRLVLEIDPDADPEISISHPADGQIGDYRHMRKAELHIVYRNITSDYNKQLPDTASRKEHIVPEEVCDNVATETHGTDTISSTTPPHTAPNPL